MGVKAILAGQGSSGTETFEAIYGTTTSAEIEAAYQKGQDVVCKYNGSVYQLISRASSTSHTFGVMTNSSGTLTDSNLICLADVWSTSSVSVTPTLYLPKTGGTMTGDLIMENQGSDWSDPPKFTMTGNNDHHAGIKFTEDGTNIDFGWEYANSDGAGLGLASVEHSSRPGVFSLYAKNSNSEITLVGKPDGSLTWAGREVVADDYYVRPNLLANGYFVGGSSQQGGGQFPINQRGQTSYSTRDYAIDRWRTWDDPEDTTWMQLTSDGIRISRTVYQYEEPGFWEGIYGKTVTVSILFADGELYSGSHKLTYNGWFNTWVNHGNIQLLQIGISNADFSNMNNNFIRAQCINPGTLSSSIKAVKLELGDTQTLAHQDENEEWVLNEISTYQQELAKCQRYFIACNPLGDAYSKPGIGYMRSSTQSLIYIAHPPMRAKPVVSYTGSWTLEQYNGTKNAVTSMATDVTSANGSMLDVGTSSGSAGALVALMANNDTTANIYLSADL